MCETLRTMATPSIVQIEGRVGGGGSEFALSCDMRFATPGSVLSQPEVALGIIPGGSGTVRLPRLVGRGRALEAILGGDDVDAFTAERWGWVNRVLPEGEIDRFVDRLAGRIARFPRHAIAAAKESVLRAEPDLEPHLLAEGAAFDRTLRSAETRAAMERFLERGGQAPEGETRLGALVEELWDSAD
jgi:enoyl-CoA hydratase/carnithine racemase